jgi:threonine/homoserine/homoserine lactone efflux protein
MCPEAAQAAQPRTQPLWFAGFIAAVSVPPAYWAVLMLVEVVKGGSPFSEDVMRGLGLLMIYGAPICLAVMLVLGYPLALLLRRLGRLSALNLCAGAFIIGFGLTAAAWLMSPSAGFQILAPVVGGATGLFAGIVFCLVAGIRFRRPSP